MEKVSEFLKRTDIKEIIDQPMAKTLSESMNRDPMRASVFDGDVMFSPADGFVIYSKIVDPSSDVMDVKGVRYTPNELLRMDLGVKRCLVVGIFMSVLDVHVNRLPTMGWVDYWHLPALKVMNLSMRPIEKAILERAGIDPNDLVYGMYNERFVSRVIFPEIHQPYYIVQLADFEVDTIVHFAPPMSRVYKQGERFSLVRLGSQVDLIIPFQDPHLDFVSLVPEGDLWHVEGGIDSLVRIDGKHYAGVPD